MRNTVRFDDDIMEALRVFSEAEGMSVTRVVNRLLRSGLAAESTAVGRPTFRRATVRMDTSRFELDKALSLAAGLEDEEIIGRSPTIGAYSAT